ncbi:MAG: hypothetical protein PHF86_05550 [Candidatus Nanoarchaeia archaeon]|nr:hypothetical protein [Candidatus Nanoarchaeia archaeon]
MNFREEYKNIKKGKFWEFYFLKICNVLLIGVLGLISYQFILLKKTPNLKYFIGLILLFIFSIVLSLLLYGNESKI